MYLYFVGTVTVYDIHGVVLSRFVLLDITSNAKITECHFWDNGVAALASDYYVYVAEVSYTFFLIRGSRLSDFRDLQGISSSDIVPRPPRVYALRTGLGYDRMLTAVTILHPRVSPSGLLEVDTPLMVTNS